MEIQSETVGETLVFSVTGNINAKTSVEFQKSVETEGGDQKRVVLDLALNFGNNSEAMPAFSRARHAPIAAVKFWLNVRKLHTRLAEFLLNFPPIGLHTKLAHKI